jgi:putative methionine-R-sulfoxide reductase with GAF domain
MDGSSWQFTPFLIPILGAAVVLTFLCVYAWQRRQDAQGTGVFIALLSLSAWWCYTYALELATTDPATMLLWVKLQWISIALLPVAWLVFALYYAGYPQRAGLQNVALLLVLPAVTIILAWTTPVHSLIYADPSVRETGTIVAFSAERGPMFYVNVVYSYTLILIATFLIVRTWRRAVGPQKQLAVVVAFGALLPFIGNAIYQVALLADLPLYVDLTVPAFAFSAILFTWGWFRLQLFDLVPELGDPVIRARSTDSMLEAQDTQVRTLNLVSMGLTILFFIALVPIISLILQSQTNVIIRIVAYLSLYFLLLTVTLWRSGPYLYRALALLAVYLGLALLDMLIGGLSLTTGFLVVAVAVMAGLLLRGRMALTVLLLGIVPFFLLARPGDISSLRWDINSLAYLVLSLLMSAGLLLVAVTTLRRDSRILLRRSRELADQLTGERLQLEQRIAERTRALETTAAVSRRLSTILDQSRLVREVVDQLEEALAYYHVHVYLWDGETDRLKMVGGTGEAGQAMLVAGHALTPSQGLVGRAYSTNKPVIVPDVSVDENWLPNPLLPSTQAEIAMPITYGDEVLGVLDVQEDEVGGLGPEDAQLLAAIAGQIAVALRNARLVAQIQQQAEQEALINAISRKIIQTTDIDSAMNIALAELTQALPAHRAVVRLSLEGEATGNGR